MTNDTRVDATVLEMPSDRSVEVELKLALRRLASGVVVITVRHDGQRNAMAATAVNALSMGPPSLLACVNRNASIHAAMTTDTHFAINILSRDHAHVAQRCGGPTKGEARFEEGDWDDSGRVPVLRDAQAVIVCKADARFDYATHTIFVGLAEQVSVHGDVDPLVYVDGTYTGVDRGRQDNLSASA